MTQELQALFRVLAVDRSRAECTRTHAAADLIIDLSALSGLYLGGASAHDLACAGRIRPATALDVERLHRMFRSEPEPHNSFGF